MSKPLAVVVAAPPYGHTVVCPALSSGYAAVATIKDLDRLLRQMAKEVPRPVLATVARADGDKLSIGLGRKLSFLTYVPADDMPPYLSCVSSKAAAGDLCFDYLGEPSWYAVRNAVPFPLALKVMRQFVFSTGLPLPDLVEWEEV